MRILTLLAAGSAAAGAAVFFLNAQIKVSYPYLVNLGEPALAQSIRFFNQGIWPYHELSSAPYSVVPYGPVYLILSALAQNLFDLPMAGGRAVCLAASVLAALSIGLMLLRCGRSKAVALGSACLFLSLPFVDRWGVQVNVDMTAVAVEMVALAGFVFYAASGYSKKAYFWIGTAAAVAAFFTKSSAVAATVAWFAHLALNRRWKDLAIFAVAAGGAVLVIYAALNLVTHGQYYFHTTVEIGRRRFFWQFIPGYWKETLLKHPLNVAAAASVLLSPAVWRSTPAGSLTNLYLAVSILLTVSLGKQGSDSNYLLPFLAASTLAAGRLWDTSAEGRRKWLVFAVAAGIAAQALFFGVKGFSIEKVRSVKAQQVEFFDRMSRVIRQFPDPVIAWDMSLLIANGRPIYFEPFPMAQAAYSGAWDQTPILDDLRNKKFPLIITYFWHVILKADRNFTPEFIREFKANYQLAGRVRIPWDKNTILFFYTPKKSQAG